MGKLTMINNVRPARVTIMQRGLARVKNIAMRAPQELGSAVGAMMGLPMMMVAPRDEFDNWADCSQITLNDAPTRNFFNGVGLSPLGQALNVTDSNFSLEPEIVALLDKTVKRGRVRQALAKPVEVKGKEVLAYIAYNGPFSAQQAENLKGCVNPSELHIFNRSYILLHIMYRPLRESPRNIMMAAELLKDQDWQDLARHLLVQTSQTREAILDYVGLHLGQEKAQELTALMKAPIEKLVEEPVAANLPADKAGLALPQQPEEPVIEPVNEERLPEAKRQELEEKLWLDVAAFAQDPEVSQNYFSQERILQECGQSGFRRGAWLANTERSIAALRKLIAVNNEQLEELLGLFGSLKGIRDEERRAQVLQQIRTYQIAVDSAESGIEQIMGTLRAGSEHIQDLKLAVKTCLGAERQALAQEHKDRLETIEREAAGDQQFLAALRESQPLIDKITVDLLEYEAQLPKWLTARQALLEAGAERLVEMPREVEALDVETLMAQFYTEDEDSFTQACKKLVEIGEPAIDPLIAALEGKLCVQAARLLGEIGHPKIVVPILISAGKKHLDKHDGGMILDCLFRMKREVLVEALIAALNYKDKYVREGAVCIFWKMAGSKIGQPAVDALTNALEKDEEERVRGMAKLALEKIAKAHNNLGAAYYSKGQFDLAIAELKQAIKIEPDFAVAHNNLGAAYFYKGQYDLAIEAYQQAIQIKPDLAVAHENLKNALAKKEEAEKAKGSE